MKDSQTYAPFLPALVIFALLAFNPQFNPHTATAAFAVNSSRTAEPPPPPLPISTGIDQQFRVPVGPPDASLAVWTLEPKAGTPVHGTILFLHGFLATHVQVQNAAEAMRRAGYRAVLVDLRGFGQSTGDHITFGVLDAHDLTQLTDALQKKDLCGKSLGVYGTSMGAATAILYAAADPRVSTLIAVAPFASIRDEVPSFSRNALGGMAALFTDSGLNKIANAVSGMVKMDLDDAKPLDAITKTKAHILLIHGDADTIIPHAASEKLQAAAPATTELRTIPNRGHLDLCFDIPGELQAMTRTWFEQNLLR